MQHAASKHHIHNVDTSEGTSKKGGEGGWKNDNSTRWTVYLLSVCLTLHPGNEREGGRERHIHISVTHELQYLSLSTLPISIVKKPTPFSLLSQKEKEKQEKRQPPVFPPSRTKKNQKGIQISIHTPPTFLLLLLFF
jgi:hypothetical protein